VSATRYRAPPADALVTAPLDDIVAVFHRGSGITHLVGPEIPDLLDVLAARWMTADAIEGAFERVEGDRSALIATLDELVVAGLVERE
jgi:PqqD family protein of HPr-rel-A system